MSIGETRPHRGRLGDAARSDVASTQHPVWVARGIDLEGDKQLAVVGVRRRQEQRRGDIGAQAPTSRRVYAHRAVDMIAERSDDDRIVTQPPPGFA